MSECNDAVQETQSDKDETMTNVVKGPASLDAALHIREAREGDIPSLLELEAGFPTDRLSERDFRKQLTSASRRVFVADRNGGPIVGYCIVHIKAHRSALRLYSIYVAPHAQGSGVGAMLIENAEALARDLGLSALYLEVRADNPDAIRFYINRGYLKNGSYYRFYEDGGTALRFRKPF